MVCDADFAVEHQAIAPGMNAALAFPCRRQSCCICGDGYCGNDWCSDCSRLSRGMSCVKGSCPECGSLYAEWITYPQEPTDVYTHADWGKGKVYYGSITRKVDDD